MFPDTVLVDLPTKIVLLYLIISPDEISTWRNCCVVYDACDILEQYISQKGSYGEQRHQAVSYGLLSWAKCTLGHEVYFRSRSVL